MSKKNRPQRSDGRQQLPAPAQQQQVVLFKYAGYSGPLPPPEILLKFNEVSPGLADRIVAMAERQSDHRRMLEKKVVYGNDLRANIGQWMAFAIGIAGIAAGTYLVMNDKPTEGLVAILGPLAAILAIFVFGKTSQRKQLASKDRNIVR